MMNSDMTTGVNKAKSLFKKLGKGGALAAIVAVVGYSSYISTDANRADRVFNSISGEFTWHTAQGIHLKIPFITGKKSLVLASTVALTEDEKVTAGASVVMPSQHVIFSDNYGGDMKVQFRLQLPTDPTLLEKVYQDFKSDEGIRNNLYRTFASEILAISANQFRAQDFMQGGRGDYKQQLFDQSSKGTYVTKRVRKLSEQSVADLSTNSKEMDKTTKQYIEVVEIQRGEDGLPLRKEHSLTKYGINVIQVDILGFEPDKDLIAYVDAIKDREKKKAEKVAEQQLEREDAITKQLTWEKERVVDQTKANIEKDKAIIAAQKRKELAQLQADQEIIEREKLESLAVIDKRKEQSVAEANKGIQEANAEAAKFEAEAVLSIGLANAKVKKADYMAIDKEILFSNNNLKAAEFMYDSKMDVTLPMYMSIGGEASEGNSIDKMSNMKLMEMLRPDTSTVSK